MQYEMPAGMTSSLLLPCLPYVQLPLTTAADESYAAGKGMIRTTSTLEKMGIYEGRSNEASYFWNEALRAGKKRGNGRGET
ncbi:hypothetical protein YDYSG_30510 [Paenibacillus tyrfis]|nr:hypothetical protein YDYSG_30510 [Paenibacillus tyrfis]